MMSRPTPNRAGLAAMLDTQAKVNAQRRKDPIPLARVNRIAQFIDNAGIIEQLETWRRADRTKTAPGGRPGTTTIRTILLLMFLLADEDNALLIRNMVDIVIDRFDDKTRERYGIALGKNYRATYGRIWRAWETLRTLLDPEPLPRGRRKRLDVHTYLQLAESARSEELWRERKDRIDWLCNQMLEATIHVLPAEYQKWGGGVAADSTFVEAFGRYHSPRSVKGISTDPDAGWYIRDPDLRDAYAKYTSTSKDRPPLKTAKWGFEACYIVQATNDPSKPADFPQLVIGIAFHRPAKKAAQEALSALRSVADRGHPAGYLIADRLYLPGAKPENFQLPIRALGYLPINDYDKNEVGRQGHHEGAILVDGSYYCPSMPESLINATRNNQRRPDHPDYIDDETHRNYIKRRELYRFRPKEKPDKHGNTPMMCPAAGPNPTANCPLKPRDGKTGSRKVSVELTIRKPPSMPPKVCTAKSSTSFPAEAGAKYWQPIPHKSDEWRRWYAHRNVVEAYNGDIKDDSRTGLGSKLRRRFRGYAATYLVTAVLTAATNLRRIASFLHDAYEKHLAPAGRRTAKKPRPPRTKHSLTKWANTGTIPYEPPHEHERWQE